MQIQDKNTDHFDLLLSTALPAPCRLSPSLHMKRYERHADSIAQLIHSGTLRPGERLPSVREASRTRGISPSTVFEAYYLLEAQGLIHSRPRSGYYVSARLPQVAGQR